MTQISEQVDCIISGLKEISALSGVRFVREYSSEPVETPVSGFLAAVGIISAERSNEFIGGDATSALKGEMYAAVCEIRLYSPNGGNGSGLSERVSVAHAARATVSSIEFDTELNTIFRRISFRLEFCLCEEGAT